MFWNKIKIATVTVCMIVLVGTGTGWLTRSRSGAEASQPAAEPQGKQEGLPEAAPDPGDWVKKEIDKVHKQIEDLARKGDVEDEKNNRAAIKARLELAAIQEDLRLRELGLFFERERSRARMKAAELEVSNLDKLISDSELRGDAMKARISEFEKTRSLWEEKYVAEKARYFKRERDHAESVRPSRELALATEYELHRIEETQARLREEYQARRQSLISRLQQLEDRILDLQPADHLRDVERKLDTLRREVGELRRALERQGNDSRKKP